MVRFLYTSALLIALSIAPTVAQAYVTPYEVFSSSSYPPPSPRETEQRVAEQEERRKSAREREQQAAFAEQHSAAEEEEVPQEEESPATNTEEETEESAQADPEFREFLRAFERVQQNREQAKLQRQALFLLGQEQTHSGAPGFNSWEQELAPTGMGSVAAGLVLLGAVTWTMRWARRKEKETLVV